MNMGVIFKISFWLIVIGLAALLTPNPSWPEWLARMVLSTGIALAITGMILPYLKRRKENKNPDE